MYEALCDRLARKPGGALVRLASAGCSSGAELYSVVFTLRTARPDLRVEALGFDVASGVVEAARDGVYHRDRPASALGIFATGGSELDPALVPPGDWQGRLFEETAGALRVRDRLREGMRWEVADASDPSLLERFGPQDAVLANNFLGPMPDWLAEACLRNVARLVRPGGLLVVDGVDLDLKQRVLGALGAVAARDRLEAAYEADPTKTDWPWTRWSHEPIDRRRPDWTLRYATMFELAAPSPPLRPRIAG
jgi:chemotaxis methyl-accepting protein methylase